MRGDIVEAMSGLQAMTAAAIAIDKRELLGGRATARIGEELTDDLLDRKIEEHRQRVMVGAIDVAPQVEASLPSLPTASGTTTRPRAVARRRAMRRATARGLV